MDKGVTFYHTRLSWGIGLTLYPGEDLDARVGFGEANGPFTELLIVDEADRLKTPALEQLRDHHDRTGIGLILIGMPGIEKRLARYAQLYSRVGFVHHRPLSAQEQAFVLARHWPELGLGDTSDFTTSEAIAAITRYHHRKLPPDLPPRRPDPARPGHQPPLGRHQGSRRGSTRIARHRSHLRAQLPPSQAQIAHQEARAR